MPQPGSGIDCVVITMYSPYDKEKYPTRKNTRLKGYDYSTPNYYFVTICTHDKKQIFGGPKEINRFGEIAEQAMMEIPNHYPGVKLDKYVVMPNHVHAILYLCGGTATLDNVIGSYKSHVSREIHKVDPEMKVWQSSFHDHIIRNQSSYEKIWLYIDANPMNWEKDCFYTP